MENQNSRMGFSCVCEKCGRTLYEGEALNIRGRFVCEPCADSFVFGSDSLKRRSVPSPFFHFIFSMLPGAGQMYLGLMKRGLFQMCLFFFVIYLAATSMPQFFGLTIPIVFFYSFFDSISLRRRISAGEAVSDDLSGVSRFVNNNRGVIAVILIIMASTGVLSAILGNITYHPRAVSGPVSNVTIISEASGSGQQEIRRTIEETGTSYYAGSAVNYINYAKSFIPLILIGLGGLIVIKSVKKKGERKADAADKGASMDFDIKN